MQVQDKHDQKTKCQCTRNMHVLYLPPVYSSGPSKYKNLQPNICFRAMALHHHMQTLLWETVPHTARGITASHQPYASFRAPCSFQNLILPSMAPNGRLQYNMKTPRRKGGKSNSSIVLCGYVKDYGLG